MVLDDIDDYLIPRAPSAPPPWQEPPPPAPKVPNSQTRAADPPSGPSSRWPQAAAGVARDLDNLQMQIDALAKRLAGSMAMSPPVKQRPRSRSTTPCRTHRPKASAGTSEGVLKSQLEEALRRCRMLEESLQRQTELISSLKAVNSALRQELAAVRRAPSPGKPRRKGAAKPKSANGSTTRRLKSSTLR